MIKNLLILVTIVFWTNPLLAYADSLDSETSASPVSLNEDLTYRFNSKEKDSNGGKWEGSANYTYGNSTINEPTTGASVADTSHQGTFELGYRNVFELGGGFTYGTTPAESLQQLGAIAYLGIHIEYGTTLSKTSPVKDLKEKVTVKSEKKNEEEEEQVEEKSFHPDFSVKLKISRITYTESPSSTPRDLRSARLLTAATTLAQSSAELSIGWDPLEWLSMGLSYTRFAYDKDVQRFMNFLSSPLAIRARAAGFGDTVSGFFIHSVAGTLTLRPAESWEFLAEVSSSLSAIDGSESPGMKIMVSKELNSLWTVGIGAEHSVSPGIVINSGIALLSYSL